MDIEAKQAPINSTAWSFPAPLQASTYRGCTLPGSHKLNAPSPPCTRGWKRTHDVDVVDDLETNTVKSPPITRRWIFWQCQLNMAARGKQKGFTVVITSQKHRC